jgi:FHS family L-fucose permease-like MFS transporter
MTDANKRNSYSTAFLAIIFTFFFWGFVAASNGVLIPMFKKNFTLTQFQSQLVDAAFYLAYFVGSLIYFFISRAFGDPLNKIGYKKGLIIGLVISASGALLFVPAANSVSYTLFLSGLFIIGLGFALLQIVANPFVINLGNPAKGSHRLNFAGGINSLGTTIGPVILAYALYGKVNNSSAPEIGIGNLKMPYLILSALLLLLALIVAAVKMPKIKSSSKFEKGNGVFQYPQLLWGMLAIFIYVGTEVTIQSNLGALLALPDIKNIDHTQVDKYISLYWGSLMIGRISGSLHSFKLSRIAYWVLSLLLPFAVFGIILYFNYLRGADLSDLYIYMVWIVMFIIIKYWGQEKPSRTLLMFSIAAMAFMVIGLVTDGDVALFSFISGGLFCSVMWPCIFNLSIAGLGKYTNQGSSLLIMMILGGAVIPPFQGHLADMPEIGIHLSYLVPLIGFAYLAWYGFAVRGMLLKQEIDYDANVE